MSIGIPGYMLPPFTIRPAGQISASISGGGPLQPVPGVPGLQPLQPLPSLPNYQGSGGGASVNFNLGLAAPAAPTAPVAPTAPAAPAGLYPGTVATAAAPGYAPAPGTPQVLASLNSQNQLVDQSGNLMRDTAGNPIYGTLDQYGRLVDANGNQLVDANGYPVVYSGHRYRSGWTVLAIGVGIVALVVGVPAAIGAYYGSKKAEG